MRCPHCQSEQTVKNGTVRLQDKSLQQRYFCQACGKRFNERTNTPMARLRTPSTIVSAVINVRTEGLGVRATARCLGKSHSTISTIIRWEHRLSTDMSQWSPLAPKGADVTWEGDEIYTRVGENFSPGDSEGWTVHFIKRETGALGRCLSRAKNKLFEQGTSLASEWAKPSQFIRWFTDGERRYGTA